MRLVPLFACGVLLAVGNAFAASPRDYDIVVQKNYVRTTGIARVAIVPFACPASLECEDFMARLVKVLAARTKLTITDALRTGKVMTAAGIDRLDVETGYILAESLKVDAFAVLDIQQAEVTGAEPEFAKMGTDARASSTPSVKHVKLALKLVSREGTPLLTASGEAHVSGMFSSLDGVAERTLELALEEATAED